MIRIASETCLADISAEGAELRGWSVAGEQLLWPGDPSSWARSSPVQFPLVGRLVNAQAMHAGVLRPMNIHGFARDQRFDIVEQTPDRVRLRLVTNDPSRQSWPYEFELELLYQAQALGIDIAMTVRNCDSRRMPYSIGLHPGFCWPVGERDAKHHEIEFEQTEVARVPVIDSKGMLTARQRDVPLAQGRRLLLSHELFEGDALIFEAARSRALRLRAPDGSAIAVTAENFGNWAIWNRPPAAFVCMEAWAGMPDRADWQGEFADRPDTRWLTPGEERSHRLWFRRETD